MKAFSAFLSGLLFGIGLIVSGMTNAVTVQNFLDLFGAWDPTLMFVMGGALLITVPGFVVLRRLNRPVFETHFGWPKGNLVDPGLVAGAALFGIGWGLAGLCPGPALVNLATGSGDIILFCAALLAGMQLHDRVWVRLSGK